MLLYLIGFLWSLNWVLDLKRKDAFRSMGRVEGNQRLLGFPVDFVFDCVFGFVFDCVFDFVFD